MDKYYTYDVSKIKSCPKPDGYSGSITATDDVDAFRKLIGTMGKHARKYIVEGCFKVFLVANEGRRHLDIKPYLNVRLLDNPDIYPDDKEIELLSMEELRDCIWHHKILVANRNTPTLREDRIKMIKENRDK